MAHWEWYADLLRPTRLSHPRDQPLVEIGECREISFWAIWLSFRSWTCVFLWAGMPFYMDGPWDLFAKKKRKEVLSASHRFNTSSMTKKDVDGLYFGI